MLWKFKRFYQETTQPNCSKPVLVEIIRNGDDYEHFWDFINYPYISIYFEHSFDNTNWIPTGVFSNPGLTVLPNTGSNTFTILNNPGHFKIRAESLYRDCGSIESNVINLE